MDDLDTIDDTPAARVRLLTGALLPAAVLLGDVVWAFRLKPLSLARVEPRALAGIVHRKVPSVVALAAGLRRRLVRGAGT